jgi:hypothetical protein
LLVHPEYAEVAELADAQDLKSCDHCDRTGSIPVFGTKIVSIGMKSLFHRNDFILSYHFIQLRFYFDKSVD